MPIAEPPKLDRPLPKVSDREREALRLTALGLTRGEIGQALYISPRTVSAHVYSARRKLLRMPPGALSLTIDQ
ncbi:MAG: helix-turn-helix transcriptional regulator [Actinobacteria bacterium]|nr:helix-turn-helix transcriptional regulator [Actinomycetota bacterium]